MLFWSWTQILLVSSTLSLSSSSLSPYYPLFSLFLTLSISSSTLLYSPSSSLLSLSPHLLYLYSLLIYSHSLLRSTSLLIYSPSLLYSPYLLIYSTSTLHLLLYFLLTSFSSSLTSSSPPLTGWHIPRFKGMETNRRGFTECKTSENCGSQLRRCQHWPNGQFSGP